MGSLSAKFCSLAFLASLLTLGRAAYASDPCSILFSAVQADEPGYKKENVTARQSFSEYKQPNGRGLDGYGGYNDILNAKLEEGFGPGKVAIDLGGGRGNAMFELAERTGGRAIVINTQAPLPREAPKQGQFEYVSGWVEEELAKHKGQADLITDVWGAFSYSPAKLEILKSAYEALKPGGEARIFYTWKKNVAQVSDHQRSFELGKWLSEHYPEIFKFEQSIGATGGVIIIRKPKGNSSPSLELPLRQKYEPSYHVQHDDQGVETNRFPEVWYEVYP